MNDPLSLSAQAVLDAAISVAESPDAEAIAAAALRAVTNDWRVDTEFIGGVEYIRTTTLESIADELEGAS
jgi:hypothetical protein